MGTGAVDRLYDAAGKAAYESWWASHGLPGAGWDKIVWSEKHAWCEAARAAREVK